MHRLALLLALSTAALTTACSNDLDGADRRPSNTEDPDKDGDGSPESEDCDDDDDTVYPGAPELCDGKDNDCDGVIPEEETDLDGDGVIECEEVCDGGPASGTVPTDAGCEYVPGPSGSRIQARVEWNMTQSMVDPDSGVTHPAWTFRDWPEFGGVMQAPVVGQLTDDNGDGKIDDRDVPDIVAVMGNDETDRSGVLRLISGDGSVVHASIYEESHTNANGTQTYTPYHHAGVAVADIDGDDHIEIVTMVSHWNGTVAECWPAVYQAVQSGSSVELQLETVYGGGDYYCGAHGPSVADIDADGAIEVILGFNALEGSELSLEWSQPDSSRGRGWYSKFRYGDGHWNSGYHSFAYDVDDDGTFMEVVAGRHIYTHEGDVWCALGEDDGGSWTLARDGYPAIADITAHSGLEVAITGNEDVAVFSTDRVWDGGTPWCPMIDKLPNDPRLDPTVPSGLPSHPNCDTSRQSFGGQPTIADFDGDGDNEIAVAGACWYSVFHFDESDGDQFKRYALAQTKDWSSASTGSTVFDFNGDDRAEVVFSDEEALYVWGVDRTRGLKPWERLDTYLEDTNHKSWTIHEYPLVADVDGDGKAEILVANAHQPDHPDVYGLYVLGAADDDWVSARKVWNQHAYYVTNVTDDGVVGYAAPNSKLNHFRNQAPGRFGAKKAPNLLISAEPPCQEGCGEIEVWVQVANEGAFITVDPSTQVALYGVKGGNRTLIETQDVGISVGPGEQTTGIPFIVEGWDAYDSLVAVVDDPEASASGWGTAKECDETDNEVSIDLDGLCP